jgi:uncharacterized protein YaaN involved in tellurite resistance
MEQIRGGAQFTKARHLNEPALREAMQGARSIDVEDDKAVVDFGIEEQREATRMAEKTVEYSRKNDFSAIRATTAEMNERMMELSIGDLKPSLWDKLLPNAAARRIKSVLTQHQDISEHVRDSIQALGAEKEKLMEYRAAAEQDIEGSEKLIARFDIKIAQLEIARDTFQKRMDRFIEENKDRQDEQVTQRLKHFEMVGALLERKVNALVSSRADQFTTLENLRNMQATYNVLIQAAEDQANYNRQAWNNTVSILTHAARQKGVQEAIDSQREAAGAWLQARGDAAVKTVENNMRVLQTGVIELEKVTESIDRAEEANLKLIEGCKAAQEKLQEMSRTIADRSAAASARTAAAARSSQAEVTEMIGSLSGANLPTRTH